MKKIFTLILFLSFVIISKSQAVLNEIYPQPGNGYHEFFELYNENNSVESLDNYTLVTYYEESGGKTGFYVMDLPNVSLSPHGYYTAASALTYNIQGQLGLTANTDWNSLGAGASLTKWERSGSSYISVAVPANLNDLFVKIVGAGGVFHVFLFKNGIIVNGLVAGLNSTVLPAYIKAMPNLPIDMSGSSPDFTINFNTLPDNSVEYLSNSAGTNNGYYRSSDGLCGDWLKSDQPGQHTPGQTNGIAANLIGQVTIAASITQYSGDPSKALLSYNITSGPAAAFPVEVSVFVDLGISGQLDVYDTLFDKRNIASIATGTQYIVLPSWDVAVIIVLKTASDCYNKTIAVGNYWSVLPVDLLSFQGNINKNNKVTLDWKVAENEKANMFEVERSIGGGEFKTTGIVFSSERTGVETYMFYETINTSEQIAYRLKMIDNKGAISYSRILIFQTKSGSTTTIKIIGNPVNDKLTFSYTADQTSVSDVKLYDISGKLIFKNKVSNYEGNNLISLSLDSTMKPGMYIVEVSNGSERQSAKFIKQ